MPRIIIGCWQLAHGHSARPLPERSELFALLRAYLDAGFTTFDCADIYTGVEELLGDFRRTLPQPNSGVQPLRVHTKFVPDRDRLATINRAYVEQIIDRSLQRLAAAQLDLVQFHWWDFDVPGYVEAAQHLADLKTAGKIGQIGLTNFDTRRSSELVEAGVPIFSNQVQWSLLDQRPKQHFAAFAQANNIRVFCYGGLAGGFLTDKYLNSTQPAEPYANRSLTKYKLMIDEAGGWDAYQSLLSALKAVAERHQAGIAEIAIVWVLDQPAVSAVIVGAGSSEAGQAGRHLPEMQRALKIALTDDDRREITAALGKLQPIDGAIYEREREKSSAHAAIMRYNLNSDQQA